MFRGSIVAIVTPFRDGVVDEQALAGLIEWHIESGTHGFVPVGTTGESPTLDHAEHERVIELCIEIVGGRRPVIAGTGSNATAEAISLTRHAKAAGPRPRWSSHPTTTSPPRPASSRIIGPSTTRSTFRSSSTTSLAEAWSTCHRTPWRGSPNSLTS
jgi:dihydrodipicolinate synthase/N-acetylneuraminate lyase